MPTETKDTLDPQWIMDTFKKIVTQQEAFLETFAKYHNRILELERKKIILQGAVETLTGRCDVLEDKVFPQPKGEPVA